MALTLIFILPLRLESCVQLLLPCFVVCLFQDYYSRKQEILRLLFSYLFVPVPHRHGDTVKKQKCPDFSIGATQKDSHSEPKISIFPPNLRVRRTCTSAYKWVDALEVDAGMPQNQFEYNMDIRKKQVLRQLFSYLFVPGAAPAW